MKQEGLLLQKKYRHQAKMGAGFLVLVLLFFSVSGFARYYQQTHLSASDSEVIVQSYFLLDNIETQLNHIEKEENPQKAANNLKKLTSSLVSYTVTRPSGTLSAENQRLLNRYYQTVQELGVNLSHQELSDLEDSEVMTSYQQDLEKAKKMEKKIFKNFRVNEQALKENQ